MKLCIKTSHQVKYFFTI